MLDRYHSLNSKCSCCCPHLSAASRSEHYEARAVVLCYTTHLQYIVLNRFPILVLLLEDIAFLICRIGPGYPFECHLYSCALRFSVTVLSIMSCAGFDPNSMSDYVHVEAGFSKTRVCETRIQSEEWASESTHPALLASSDPLGADHHRCCYSTSGCKRKLSNSNDYVKIRHTASNPG
jgi:hypothetical protein